MTETTAKYDILRVPILSITQHWPMWLTLLNDGFCQINEMWTTAVIMLLASIIFSCSWLSWWLMEAVVILSKVNRPKRIRCKLAFPYVSLKVHQNNTEKKGWLLQQLGSLTHQFEQHCWISSFYKDYYGHEWVDIPFGQSTRWWKSKMQRHSEIFLWDWHASTSKCI